MTGTPPARRSRRRLSLLGLAALCLLAALATAAAPALAASPRIVRPAVDQVVVGPHGKLAVEVKGKRPGLTIDGRGVKAHLHRSRGAWRGSLAVAGLAVGGHNLVASSGGGIDTSRFLVARQASGAVKFGWHTSWRKRGAHLLNVRTRRAIWNIAGYPKVTLNGKRVSGRLAFDEDDRGFSGGFGANSGLRYGKNTVKAKVLLTDGDFASATKTFQVGRGRPLVGAGPDRRVAVGEPVVLDGSSTRLPSPKAGARGPAATASLAPGETPLVALEPIEYEWKVLSAPVGPPPVIEEPEEAMPILTPKVPGTYELELLAKPENGGAPAADVTTVSAPQTTNPMGVPIQTITDSGAIQFGREESKRIAAGVKMLVLSAGELAKASGEWGPAEQTFVPQANGEFTTTRQEPGAEKPETVSLLTAIGKVGKQQVVILSGQGEPLGGDAGLAKTPEAKSQLAEAIAKIGGTVNAGQTPDGAVDLAGGEWSVIGQTDLVEGHARQNIDLGQAPVPAADTAVEFPAFPKDGGSPGSLNGFMQGFDSSTYQFVSPEFLSLDTKWTSSVTEAPSSTQNVIAVGPNHYASASIPEGALAVQLLVLDGSEPTKVLENGTYTVMNPQRDGACSAAAEPGPGQIEALDGALGYWATHQSPTGAPSESNLVILQDFGHQESNCFPGGADTDWLQDTLPSITKEGGNWIGSSWPTERSQLISMWNDANAHGFGSVAGNIGRFVGTAAHDEVANYHRPFYDSEKQKTFDRSFGGLTLVASTNLYQRSSAFFQGQGESGAAAYAKDPAVANGRVTGVLRRNQQSQWALESAAGLAGFGAEGQAPKALEQASLLELMFRAPTPWPCSTDEPAPCQGTTAEIAAAQKYFVARLAPKSAATDVRALYVPAFGGDAFQAGPLSRDEYPSVEEQRQLGGGTFTKALYETMRKGSREGNWRGLVGEIENFNTVNEGIKAWRGLFEKSNAENVGIHNVGQEVLNELNKVNDRLERENKEEQASNAVYADSLYFLSDAVEIGIASTEPEAYPVAAPAIGALASMIDLGDDTADALAEDGAASGEGNVANDTESIRAKVTELSSDTGARYERIAEAMNHFGSIFVADPEKLREAAANLAPTGEWDLTASREKPMKVLLAGGVQIATFKALLPITFVQWVTSPHFSGGFKESTSNNEGSLELPAGLGYRCEDTTKNPESGKTRNPWTNKPETTWAMESVGYTGGGPTKGTNFAAPENSQAFTIRGLKSAIDDMVPDRDEEAEIPGLKHSGTMASPSLMKRLLGAPNPGATAISNSDLGADKEEIFGLEGWTMRKFGCGVPNE